MNLRRLHPLILLTVTASTIFCLTGCKQKAAPPAPPAKPAGVLIEVQTFSMPRSLAVQTIFNQPASVSAEAIFKSTQDLVASKQATLVATSALSVISGNQAIVESILEFRYPSEYEEPQIPQSFGTNATVTKVTKTTTVTEETTSFPQTPTTPTAFEVKNTGSTLQVEPMIDDSNSIITLNIAFQNVAHTGMLKYKAAENSYVEQPEFYTKKFTTNVVVKNGGVVLLGTVEPDRRASKDTDMTEVAFLRATLR